MNKDLKEPTPKINKGITLLIIILSLISILSLGYIGYEKILKNDEPKAEKKESSKKLPKTLKDLHKTEAEYLNIKEVKKHYATMENVFYKKHSECKPDHCVIYNNFNGDKINSNFDSDMSFVKVKNNKLFWKVNGNWVQDTKILENIIYFYISEAGDVGIIGKNISYEAIIYSNKALYKIILKGDFNTNNPTLNNKDFSEFEYVPIAKNIEIDNIEYKLKPVECDLYYEYYVLSQNKIYVINNNKLEELNKGLSDLNEVSFNFGTCQEFGYMFNINIDGKVKGIQSKLNEIKPVKSDNIVVEYYLAGENYELLIDSNKNYYLYNTFVNDNGIKSIEKIDELKPTGKIKYIGYENERNRVKITTDDENMELYDINPRY